jgi:hypothetical protein
MRYSQLLLIDCMGLSSISGRKGMFMYGEVMIYGRPRDWQGIG